MKYNLEIKKELDNSIEVKQNLSIDDIDNVVSVIIEAYKNRKKIIWFGNGGSAADAQHLSAELVGRFQLNRKPLNSISLTTNTSILTAISNDYSFDSIFSRQVESLVNEGDILIGITTSGKSPNVLRALEKGKELGGITIGLTGDYIELLKKCSDYIISVPSNITCRIQEAHITIGHIICFIVEKEIFGEKSE
jgi:D-sedoheptulose 7-phosphate isomerase